MNATEHLVEAYLRVCGGYFTMQDVKVEKGNNRQLDILGFNLKDNVQLHVEVGVTHCVEWCPRSVDLPNTFGKKFFGEPAQRTGKKTDMAKGKNYRKAIEDTYRKVGLDPKKVKRIWVCWMLKDRNTLDQTLTQIGDNYNLPKDQLEIWEMRDRILPELQKKIGTAHYDDEILRTLSIAKELARQSGTRG